ncbi:YihY/virulence factor BrkB family protein [Chloroflexota bacterium]
MKIRDKCRRFRDRIQRFNIKNSHIPLIVRNLRQKQRQIKERLLAIPLVQLFVRTIKGLGPDDASHLAAGVAYYSLLSLFPLVLGLIALLGLLLPSESIQKELFDFFESNFPGSSDLLERNIRDIIQLRSTLGVLSLVLLLWSGSAMFGAVSRAINRAWGIRFEHERPFYKRKPRDLAMILGIGLLLILSIGTTTVFTILSGTDLPWMSVALSFGAGLLAFLLNIVIFLLLYKYIPHTRTSWHHIWPGALLAAILFEIAKTLFTLYLGRFVDYEVVYGSVGSVIALLVWVYICAFILIVGAEFSFEYGRMRKEGIRVISMGSMLRKRKKVNPDESKL